MARGLLLALLLAVSGVFARLSDIAWVDQPQSWHQQAIRIVDHPFTTLPELRSFALAAKRAGVSVVELVGPQKDSRCVGYWCGGLGLCDHINGSFPAKDGTLAEWRQVRMRVRARVEGATGLGRGLLVQSDTCSHCHNYPHNDTHTH